MPDYLSCGSCPVDFELADIVSFIEHKRQRCVDGSVDSDQLECIQCSKRFHTPWPLLFHIQVDHKILIVRNLKQLSLPLTFKTSMTPIVQLDESVPMELDLENSQKSSNHRDMFTQTVKARTSSSCCQPRNLPPCCQKIEPQCYDEPCVCPSVSNIICTSESCYINIENQHNSDSEGNPSSCCACPQGSLKKESREVQTDFEYIDDDISFLLSNNPENTREFNDNGDRSFAQQAAQFNGHEYSNDYSITIEKEWDYLTHTNTQITDHSNANYLANFDAQGYQALIPNHRATERSNQNYVPSNTHMVVDSQNRSLASSPNHVTSTDNVVFPLLTVNSSINGHGTLFHESNNLYNFKGLNAQEPPAMATNALISNHSPPNKDSTPSFSRNENCSLSFIPSSSDLSADLNNDNYEYEKIENERKEFRFLCPNCGKRFRQKVHLRKHVMSQHARQKPHKCSQCGYTTVEKSHLTVHIRTHTGERPYTCRRCSYSSAQNCTLKSHYLRRHPGDQIECILCTSYFITEQERNNHQRSCRIVNGVSTNGNTNGHTQTMDNTDSLKAA